MHHSEPFDVLPTLLDSQNPETQLNYQKMIQLCDTLKERLASSVGQGEAKYVDKHQERGKLLARDRIELLLDEDSPFLELMPLAGHEQEDVSLGGSIVGGIGVVSGRLCLVNANIPTIKGGAINEVTLLKSNRLDEIALENNLPVIYLNESAGADLTQQAKIFNYGGKAFREITRRSSLGIPSISVVFGSSTAGGAYIPGMSDYVIMVKNQARTYLAGPPLVKMAINEEVDDESLGGAEMHSKESGLCDFMVEDEVSAIKKARQIMATFPSPSVAPGPIEGPIYPSEDLLQIVSSDVRKQFDAREVIARLVDGSKFLEFKPLYGETLVTGWADIFGHKVGILANNGVLFSAAANKGAHFIQLCNKKKIPLIFLQNITGFMVGKKSEEEGIIKNGAKLINAVSNSKVPAITIVMGASYGAGNYGMCGRAYSPRFLFSWPNARLAVMGETQLVGVLEILQAQKAGAHLDKAKMTMIKEGLRKRINQESDPYYSTSRLWDDGIIDPRDTREVLGLCLSVIRESEKHDVQTANFGIFRM